MAPESRNARSSASLDAVNLIAGSVSVQATARVIQSLRKATAAVGPAGPVLSVPDVRNTSVSDASAVVAGLALATNGQIVFIRHMEDRTSGPLTRHVERFAG
jgi:hypothetical protein